MCKRKLVSYADHDEAQQNQQYSNKIIKTEHPLTTSKGETRKERKSAMSKDLSAAKPNVSPKSSKSSKSVTKLLDSLDSILQKPDLRNEIGEEGYDHCKNLQSILARQVRGEKGNGASRVLSRDDASSKVPAIPQLTTVTPWTISSIPNTEPPLPEIFDPVLEKAAFTHAAIDASNSYERLEWVGDIYLEMIATLLISSTFPNLSAGRCSQLRERLVKNETLASFSDDYNFRQRAILPREFETIAKNAGKRGPKKEGLKVMGDIFEAYCAAIVYSDPENGINRLATWIKALWARVLSDEIQTLKPSDTTIQVDTKASGPKNPREVLNCKIVSKSVKLRYRDEAPETSRDITNAPIFVVGVYLEGWGEQGKLLGVGRALSKKEACQKAAEAALANRELSVYENMKIAYDAKRKAESSDTATPANSGFC